MRAESWAGCAEQCKTPGGIWAEPHGTAGLNWDTDQGDSRKLESEDKNTKLNTGTTQSDICTKYNSSLHDAYNPDALYYRYVVQTSIKGRVFIPLLKAS